MSVEKSNEVTVRVKCDINELYETLEIKGFEKVDTFSLNDFYFVKNDLGIENMSVREILAQAVIVREVYRNPDKIVRVITFKKKEFDSRGNIISQKKIECDVFCIEDAKVFLNAIGYREIMNIVEDDKVYQNGKFKVSVKDIRDGIKLIESDISDECGIDWVKERFEEFEIPICDEEWFVKKAEIELEKALGKEGI